MIAGWCVTLAEQKFPRTLELLRTELGPHAPEVLELIYRVAVARWEGFPDVAASLEDAKSILLSHGVQA
jgi:hypothetical protein